MFFSIETVVIVAMVATAQSNSINDPFSANRMKRIVGGQDATENQFPWTVALYHETEFICTASIISETSILTAAHCVVSDGVTQTANSFHGVIGSINKSSSDATYIGFKNIAVHPGYNGMNNDVAILEISAPLTFSKRIQKICIANSKMGKMILKSVVAMGWGGTTSDENSNVTPNILKYVSQIIVSNFKCFISYLGNPTPSSVLCATGLGSGVCTGDSGGPLVYYAGRFPIQVGIASYVNGITGCGHLLGPAVFVRVSSYTAYIKKTAPGSVCVA